MNQLHTPFSNQKGIPLPEYPRPQMVRNGFLNLNGVWQFEKRAKKEPFPTNFTHQILVPFSPQSVLSKVDIKVKNSDYLYYQKEFTLPQNFFKGKLLLHFGAVDMFSVVYVNGKQACEHVGGFHPFTVDITPYVEEVSAPIKVQVLAWDVTDSEYHTTGKQSLRRGGIWYTPQSGIWQTVWCESVPQNYIEKVKITSLYDQGAVQIEVEANGDLGVGTAEVTDNGARIATGNFTNNSVTLNLSDFTPWSPENPHLYNVKITFAGDEITSYFGMRKFSIVSDGKYQRICLNNKPYFMNGVLDQGYWSDGMLTPPSDEAMRYDVAKMKELGFNMLRKHIKIEPLRWYYYCDLLGIIVWQDAPSGGRTNNNLIKQIIPLTNISVKDNKYRFFGRENKTGREEFLAEYRQMLDYLYNVVSIAVWVPFNEGWGQFDALAVADLTRQLDSTRLIDHVSGPHDQQGGDFKSLHVYFKKLYPVTDNRAFVVSEFGGYSLLEKEHVYNPRRVFGYKAYKSKENLMKALEQLFLQQVVPLIDKGLCATVYTQVSDVEDEINGLLTYDRVVCKVDEDKMRTINAKVHY